MNLSALNIFGGIKGIQCIMIRVGAAGWTHASLAGERAFYPPGLGQRDYLKYYASRFSSVETASTFFRIPTMEIVSHWVNQTPDHFVFHFQVPGMLTGFPIIPKNLPSIIARDLDRELLDKRQIQAFPKQVLEMGFDMFTAGMRPAVESGKLGAVICRFPPWFEPDESSFAYLDLMDDKTRGLVRAVEFLNAAWQKPEAFSQAIAFFKPRNIAFAATDSFRIRNYSGRGGLTKELAYLRFSGRSQEIRYLYSQPDLQPWLARTFAANSRAKNVYAVFASIQGMDAVLNARLFINMLKWEAKIRKEHKKKRTAA